MDFILASYESQLRSLLRIVAGFTFSLHGYQKLFGALGGPQAQLGSLMGVAGCLETIGGALIILGLFTRPTAFILSGQMAVAYFMVHQAMGALPIQNNGEPAVLYCFAFLYIAARGAGIWSVDSLMRGTGSAAG